jgi:hypothetical protein
MHTIGYFVDEIEAAVARDKVALELQDPEFAYLNFPL